MCRSGFSSPRSRGLLAYLPWPSPSVAASIHFSCPFHTAIHQVLHIPPTLTLHSGDRDEEEPQGLRVAGRLYPNGVNCDAPLPPNPHHPPTHTHQPRFGGDLCPSYIPRTYAHWPLRALFGGQAFVSTFKCTRLEEIELSGKDASSLADLLLNQQSQGKYGDYRLGHHDSNPLSRARPQPKRKRTGRSPYAVLRHFDHPLHGTSPPPRRIVLKTSRKRGGVHVFTVFTWCNVPCMVGGVAGWRGGMWRRGAWML